MADESEVLNEERAEAPVDDQEISESRIEEAAEDARRYFQEIVTGLDVDAAVGIKAIDERDIHLDADGIEESGGILIGRRGQTLEAIQLLIATIISRQYSKNIRVFLDAFGYRERREESLRQMALEVAEQVRSAGQEALTEPLNAADRRIIHTALVDMEGIATYSEGDDPNRYVVITPAEE